MDCGSSLPLTATAAAPPPCAAPPPQVVPSLETSSVYSFLATITKDHGEIDASVELLRVSQTFLPLDVELLVCRSHFCTCDPSPCYFLHKRQVSLLFQERLGQCLVTACVVFPLVWHNAHRCAALLFAGALLCFRVQHTSKHEHTQQHQRQTTLTSTNVQTPPPPRFPLQTPHQPQPHQVAASIDPTNASCALGLVHGHEIRGDYAKALAAAKSFLAKNPEGGVGARGVKNRCGFGASDAPVVSNVGSSV